MKNPKFMDYLLRLNSLKKSYKSLRSKYKTLFFSIFLKWPEYYGVLKKIKVSLNKMRNNL